MYERAMDKIRDEMAANKGAVCMVGDIVTMYLQSEPANAEKILTQGKTLKGAYAAMRDHARANRIECMTTDDAAVHIAKYYGIEPQKMADMLEARRETYEQAARQTAKPQAHAEADDLDLDALLGL